MAPPCSPALASAVIQAEFFEKPSIFSDPSYGDMALKLYHNLTGAPFVSGQTITIETNKPDKLPLPSFGLLNLQWHLSRLVAMAGGADIFDDKDFDDDNGKDDRGLLL